MDDQEIVAMLSLLEQRIVLLQQQFNKLVSLVALHNTSVKAIQVQKAA